MALLTVVIAVRRPFPSILIFISAHAHFFGAQLHISLNVFSIRVIPSHIPHGDSKITDSRSSIYLSDLHHLVFTSRSTAFTKSLSAESFCSNFSKLTTKLTTAAYVHLSSMPSVLFPAHLGHPNRHCMPSLSHSPLSIANSNRPDLNGFASH
ncbi:hypothetical protein DFH06DRAFT_174548 [Mycena polygramma]|nr:hypothetical protein DFH06DRAFT_174548 [Mycena polygramma]